MLSFVQGVWFAPAGFEEVVDCQRHDLSGHPVPGAIGLDAARNTVTDLYSLVTIRGGTYRTAIVVVSGLVAAGAETSRHAWLMPRDLRERAIADLSHAAGTVGSVDDWDVMRWGWSRKFIPS
jgi:hypothetical protein